MPEQIHVGVYGEVNANLIDGSSVWLQSVCLTLATIPGVRVTLLLRAPVERDLLLEPLMASPDVDVVEPGRWAGPAMLDPETAARALTDLDAADRFDFLVLRGAGIAERVGGGGGFDGRLWLYYVPTADSDPEAIGRYGTGAHRVLCQTPEIERHVTEVAPALAERLLPLPPMVPPVDTDPEPAAGPIERIVYAGKVSPEYYFFEMVELLGLLRERLPGVELHVAGDKIHNPPEDPTFRERAESALRETEGLVWHGAMGRDQIADLVGSADIALSIRHPSLDESVEMSTKVLEYGAAGRPVVLNSTPFHLAKLGEDYPLAVNGVAEARDAILEASANAGLRREAAGRLRELSLDHSFERTADRLRPHLEGEAEATPAAPRRGDGARLVVAGHNLAFAEPLLDRVRAAGAELREDIWQGHSGGDEHAGLKAVGWATTILCEWCLGNAVWYSRNRQPGQRLVVRFHRMELETSFPHEVDLDGVDAMVFVAEHVKEAACEAFGWPPDAPQLTVVPNAVDFAELALPKLPGAEFNLGLIGYVPRIKRLDRAIEILERLRITDDRYRLIVKGRGPWEYPWMAAREEERRYYEDLFARIDRSPILRQAVVFEPFGEDIPKFLQQVGWIVSTSEIEGHSVALAEGMTSGAIPVVIDRPGAKTQYEERWVHPTPEAAARAILACAEGGAVERESDAAAGFAERWSWERIGPVWDRLLLGAN